MDNNEKQQIELAALSVGQLVTLIHNADEELQRRVLKADTFVSLVNKILDRLAAERGMEVIQ